ncbi:MAG: Ig domain-containing protein, partial [Nanoarchaeota archaeon]
LEGLLRKGMPLGLVAALGCHGGRDSEQPDDTGRDSSYTDDSGETGDSGHTGDTDTATYNAPVITSSSTATAYLNTPFTYTVTATQDDGAGTLTCRIDELPFDVSYSNNGCTMSFTVTDEFMVGENYNLDVEVEDSYGEDEASLELTIAESSTNTAPVIETTSLSSATVNTAYSATVSATDVDGDDLTYSILNGPSWLSINSSGRLSGTPTSSGTSTVEVKVSDPDGLYDTASYSLLVASVASVDMSVIDGDSGAAADSSCSIDVTLTNSTSGYSETVTMDASGVSSFSLDETGLYNISVPATNTGSNCYGGVSLDEWIDVAAGTNSSWVTLIPETYADEVASVVGSQIDMGDITSGTAHASGAVDNVTKLLKYESGVSSRIPYTRGWNSSIKDGSVDLEVDTIDYTYDSLQYNDGLQLAIGYWDGNLAPSVVQIASGGDIWFTRTSNWQTDVNTSSYVIADVEIDYTVVGDDDVYSAAMFFAHEMGHSLFEHTNVDVFIMDSSPTVDEPHELELLIARVYNNIGAESPAGGRVDLYNGYTE